MPLLQKATTNTLYREDTMAEYEKVILTNMCMVSDANGRYLVENRLDPSWPGLAFPGGHLERGESVTDSVVR